MCNEIDIPDRCPKCDLILLCGAIFDAAARVDELGPIYGISRETNLADCRAAYIGLGSAFLYRQYPELYRCPRCGVDPLNYESSW